MYLVQVNASNTVTSIVGALLLLFLRWVLFYIVYLDDSALLQCRIGLISLSVLCPCFCHFFQPYPLIFPNFVIVLGLTWYQSIWSLIVSFLFLGQVYFCCITSTFEFVTFSTYFPFCSSLSSLAMDFGSSNHVREPKSLHLIVTNTSGISSNLSLSVRHYPSPQTGRGGGAVATDRKQK